MTTPNDLVVRARLVDELSKPLAHVRGEFAATAASTAKAGTSATRTATDYDRLRMSAARAGEAVGTGLSKVLIAQHDHAGVLSGSLGRLVTGYAALRVAQAGYRAVADVQDAEKSFEGLVGSQKQALELTRSLQGLKSPFSTSGILGGAQSLLTFGADAATVVPTMRALSDAITATGGNSTKLTAAADALAQMRQDTFLTSGALSRLQSQGLPAADILAKAHGMTQYTFKRAIDSGALRVTGQQAADELTKGFADRYGGASSKGAQTLSQAVGELGNSASRALYDAIGPELPQITAFVNSMAADLPGLAHAASPFLHVLGGTLGVMADHPHLTEALVGFLIFREVAGPALRTAGAMVEMGKALKTIKSSEEVLLLMRSLAGMPGGLPGMPGTPRTPGTPGLPPVIVPPGSGPKANPRASRWGGAAGKWGTRAAIGAVAGFTVNELAGAGIDLLQGHFGHGDDGRATHWQDPVKLVLGEQKAAAAGAATGAEFGGLPGAAVGAVAGGAAGLGKGFWDFFHHRQSYSMSDAGKAEHAARQQASSLLGGVQINVHGQSLDEIMAKVTPAMRAQIEAALQLQASGTGRPRGGP